MEDQGTKAEEQGEKVGEQNTEIEGQSLKSEVQDVKTETNPVSQEELMRQIVELQKRVIEKKPEKQKGNGARIFFVVVMVLVGLTYASIFFFGGLMGLASSYVPTTGLGYVHNIFLAPVIAIMAIWAAVDLILKKPDAKILTNVTFGLIGLYELSGNIDGYMQMTDGSSYSMFGRTDGAQALIMSLGRFVLGVVVVGVLTLVFNKTKAAGEKTVAGMDGNVAK